MSTPANGPLPSDRVSGNTSIPDVSPAWRVMDEFVSEHGFSGIVGIRIGAEQHIRAVGERSVNGDLHDVAELFPICSITKLFTAVAVMRLAEEGKLSLRDKLSTFIPDPRGLFADATIEDALVHKGLPDFSPEEIDFGKAYTFQEMYESIDSARARPPYSNFGYVVLAQVIEKASGKSYKNCLKEQIFSIASIHPTVSLHDIPRQVEGVDAKGKVLQQDSPEVRWGSGNLYATISDCLKFEEALSQGKILNASNQSDLYENHFGFDRVPFEKGLLRAKAGAMGRSESGKPIISTVLYSIPEKNMGLCVFCSRELKGDAGWAADLGEAISKRFDMWEDH